MQVPSSSDKLADENIEYLRAEAFAETQINLVRFRWAMEVQSLKLKAEADIIKINIDLNLAKCKLNRKKRKESRK